MVRFSDMLGGNTDPEDARATAIPASDPIPAVAADDEHEPADDVATEAADAQDDGDVSPQAVLDRLTQYATSTRAPDQVPAPVPDEDPSGPDAPDGAQDGLTHPSDDLLPQGKRVTRKSRRPGKRRP